MYDLTKVLHLASFRHLIKIFCACFTKSKLISTHRYNLCITGELKYRIVKYFIHEFAGEVMIAISNYDTEDTARY